MEGEPSSSEADLRKILQPGKRILASSPPAPPGTGRALAAGLSRGDEAAASSSGAGQKKITMTSNTSGVFKIPMTIGSGKIMRKAKNKVRKPGTQTQTPIATTNRSTTEENRKTNDSTPASLLFLDSPEMTQRTDGQVEIAMAQSCLDILDPNVSPSVVSGLPDLSSLANMELSNPLPTTKGFTQDFLQDWNSEVIGNEEQLPPGDDTDFILLQAAEPNVYPVRSEEELPSEDETVIFLLPSTVAETESTNMEEVWELGKLPQEPNQPNMTIFHMSLSPTFASPGSHSGSSSATATPARTTEPDTDGIPIVVNLTDRTSLAPSPSPLTAAIPVSVSVRGADPEEEVMSTLDQSSTSAVVLSRRNSSLLQRHPSTATSGIPWHPQPQGSSSTATVTNDGGSRKRRGRPPRFTNIQFHSLDFKSMNFSGLSRTTYPRCHLMPLKLR